MDSIGKSLKNLTEAHGVSGYEAPVSSVVEGDLKPFGQLSKDKLGSLVCQKNGGCNSPRIMLAGRMEKNGFVVERISGDGDIRILPFCGWFDQTLLGKRVIIKTNKGDVSGVFGVKPPQLNKTGVPTIVLSVPARHIHSHHAIMYRDDYDLPVDL